MKTFPLAICLAACALSARSVHADTYRLRADALAAAKPSAGLLVLQGEVKQTPWLNAEGLVWAGVGERNGDVLVISIGVKDPKNRGEARVGRMMLTAGAVRPVHMDGASLRAWLPWGIGVEAFGGVPVEPAFGSRNFDWLLGQRLSMRLLDRYHAGVSYLHRRDGGRIAYEEVGFDGSFRPLDWMDGAGTVSIDTADGRVNDAKVSIAAHSGLGRVELFGTHRLPSRMLPATSLFAALGAQTSSKFGISGFWRVAPRLDVSATGTFESIAGSFAADQTVRATLRLDDHGEGSVGVELRRQNVTAASWTGARATARVPIKYGLGAAAEVEVVAPDHGGSRGSVWPWGLVALSYRPSELWEMAAAFEGGASPTAVASYGGLLRVAARWDVQR